MSLESRVPANRPLRAVRALLDRALVLEVLYSIRSERLLMEQLDYDLRFRGSAKRAS